MSARSSAIRWLESAFPTVKPSKLVANQHTPGWRCRIGVVSKTFAGASAFAQPVPGKVFTMDRALAGRRQAAVKVQSGAAEIEGIHQNCPTHLIRGAEFRRLEGAATLEIDDMIVAGTSIVAVRAPQT
jgi:hypothetical protein